MARRTEDQWRELIEQHAESGLTAKAFCAQQNINAKHFSTRKQELTQKPEDKNTGFVAIKAPALPTSMIELQWEGVRVRCPVTLAPQWLADFARALR